MSSSRNIRLFIDAHSFDNEFQGTRTFIRELYREFLKLSDHVTYYIGAADTDNLKKEFDFIPGANFIKYRASNSFARIYFEIPRLLKTHQIDIAHFQYISPFRKHCDYIVTTHDILFNDFKSEFSFLFRFSRNFLFKHSIKHAAFKTTVSAYSRQRIGYHYQMDESKIHIIPNGVNDQFYKPFNKQMSQDYIRERFHIDKFIVYISRIEPRKNNIALLRAWLGLKLYQKGISLVFIGKTSIRSASLDETIAAMPDEAKRLFAHIEQVSDADLLRFYQAAEAFVYPSKAEGFGIPPLEAAALKVPVLCSSRTAMKDYTFFGRNFFDPENEEELMTKLADLLAGRHELDYAAISEQVRKNYSWKASAEKLYSLLQTKYSGL